MTFTYENQGTNTYLVYEIGAEDALDTMSLGMLTNNDISGFAAVSFMQMDTTKYIKYNVSSKISAKQLFSGPVNKKRLLGVFSGVVAALLAAEDYMLDPATVLLDPEYIFTDVSTCETELVCLPVLNPEKPAQNVEMFFKNILFTTQFDQTENCDHVAQLINYMNGNPSLALAEFKELLDKLNNTTASAPVAPAPSPVAPAQQPAAKTAPQPVQQPVAAQQPVAKPVQQPVAAQQPVAKPVQQPAQVVVPQPAAQPAAAPESDEKEISWFYLMQHYNKENAEKYKAQQEAKKGKKGKAAESAAPKKATKQPAAGFAVPGQKEPVNPGFAIPGQPAPAPVAAAPQPVAKPAPQPMVSKPAPQPAPTPAPQPVQPQPVATPINFGETTVLGGGTVGETTVLGAPAQAARVAMPYLIRAKNNEKIPLNKPVFRVGKEKSYVDYFIGDNTAISRSHANFYTNEGEYFVEDTNSTNHTFVNGKMIPSGMKFKISSGDTIRLANEDFTFSVE